MISRDDVINHSLLDTSHWNSICDLSLTLRQARQTNNGILIALNQPQCEEAFRFFMKRLNRAVYGNAVWRGNKRLRVIPVVEKSTVGRWHIHAAIEPPLHIDLIRFDELIRRCWATVDWAYDRMVARDNADRGWINYMLKRQAEVGA